MNLIKHSLILCGFLLALTCLVVPQALAEESHMSHQNVAASPSAADAGAASSAHESGDAHGDHGHAGVPAAVLYQAINFAIFVIGLFFVLRSPVRGFFAGRGETYNQALAKAQQAKAEAEERRNEIQDRLRRLESTSEVSIANAKKDAENLILQMKAQADEVANRLKAEAKNNVEIELERAKQDLRQDLLSQAVALSRKMLEDKMLEPDQKRLQTEFVEKIREVNT